MCAVLCCCVSPPSPDTIRFMVATDNHLGYCEADPVRRDDSFRTFEELLHQSSRHHCDFLLLGGDLFHENKPSRPTLYRAIHLLRSAVMGDRPVSLELLSDGQRNFPLTGQANYLDPNVNIALPIFSIHGNHDDPAGVGQYSPMDILHEALLINYFVSQTLSPALSHSRQPLPAAHPLPAVSLCVVLAG